MRQRSRRCLSVTVSYFPSSRSLPSRLLERRYAGIIHTPSPNPSWKPGDKISSPVNEMVLIDAHTTSPAQMYKLMIGSIIPRPIAFVSTKSQAGLLNLAPFSFFNGVSSNPPCIMFSVTRKADGEKKDTLLNIEETREFVVNTVAEWMAEPMNHCSAEFPYGVSEMEKAGLTAIPSIKVGPPRVKESPIQMECTLYNTMQVGEGLGSATIVVGKIECMHIHQKAYQNGRVLPEELQPVARLAGMSYGRLNEIFDIDRPSFKKPKPSS